MFNIKPKSILFVLSIIIVIIFGLNSKTEASLSSVDETIAYFDAVQKGDWQSAIKYDRTAKGALGQLKVDSKDSWSVDNEVVEQSKHKILMDFKRGFNDARKVDQSNWRYSLVDPAFSYARNTREIWKVFPNGATLTILERKGDKALIKIEYTSIKLWAAITGFGLNFNLGLTKEEAIIDALVDKEKQPFKIKESYIEIGKGIGSMGTYNVIAVTDEMGRKHTRRIGM